MKLRIISSIVAILLLFLFLFYLPAELFFIFVFLIVFLMELELHKLLYRKLTIYFAYSVIFTFILFIGYLYLNENIFFQIFTLTCLIAFSYIVLKFENFSHNTNNIVKFLFSILYIPMFSLYALIIYKMPLGKFLLLHLLIICWATDSFAFLTGKNFGTKKLHPLVSPKKTVEGFLGGIAGGIIFGIVGLLFVNFPFLKIVYISLFVSLACVMGDLFESAIKRKFNVKDSGFIFPGHGGILDRIDGVLFAVPIYYFLVS